MMMGLRPPPRTLARRYNHRSNLLQLLLVSWLHHRTHWMQASPLSLWSTSEGRPSNLLAASHVLLYCSISISMPSTLDCVN